MRPGFVKAVMFAQMLMESTGPPRLHVDQSPQWKRQATDQALDLGRRPPKKTKS